MIPRMVATLHRTKEHTPQAQASVLRADSRALRWAIACMVGFGIVFIFRATTVVNGERTFTLFDDAMVSMRYAHNLARGNGLVWNAGQPGVEGYTNFLWTLWMAALHLTGVPLRLLGLLVSVSGLAILAGNLAVIAAICRELAPERPSVERTALLLSATCYPLLYWTLRGMEVGLVAIVLSSATLFAIRFTRGHDRAIAGLAVMSIIGVLTRTDVAVPLAVILGCTVWCAAGARRRVALFAPAAAVAALVVHTLIRLRWYGEALPNTYALKLAGISLSDRVHRGVGVASMLLLVELLLPVGLVAIGIVTARRGLRREITMLCGVVAACVAYAVYVGGDAWEWMRIPDRYVAPVLPLFFVVAGFGAAHVAELGRSRRIRFLMGGAALLVAGAAIAQLAPFPRAILQLDERSTRIFVLPMLVAAAVLTGVAAAFRYETRGSIARASGGALAVALVLAVSGPALGRWADNGGDHVSGDVLAAHLAAAVDASTAPDATVAVAWAGSFPYFSDRPAIDLLGKSDPVIARSTPHDIPLRPGHMRWDYAYSIGSLRPDLIVTLWNVTSTDLADLDAWGYVQLDHDGDVWVRSDSRKVDIDGLRRGVVAAGL